MRIYFSYFLISVSALFLVSVFFSYASVEAAQISLETQQTTIGVAQRFEVSVYVHSEGETVNAFAGTINLPSFLTPLTIRDGDSLVALWSKRPEISMNDISFAGIIPGGWKGVHGYLFSFIVEASTTGDGAIDISKIKTLLNDGKGTPAFVSFEPLSINVNKTTPVIKFEENIKDDEPPEMFKLDIARSDELFSGDMFLVFTAQDKKSGIDHYEILEVRKKLRDETKGEWESAKSPYRLLDQSLTSFVYVRAVDRAGNVRVSVYTPEEKKASLPIFVIVIILLSLIFVIKFLVRLVRG